MSHRTNNTGLRDELGRGVDEAGGKREGPTPDLRPVGKAGPPVGHASEDSWSTQVLRYLRAHPGLVRIAPMSSKP